MSSPFSRSPKCYAVWVPGRVWECGWIPVYFVTPPPPDWKDTSDQGTLWNLVGQIFLWIFPLREKSDILFLLTVAEKKEKQPSSWGACGFAIGWWYRISEEPSTMWSESLRALESTLGGFKDFFYIFIRKLGKTFTHFDDAIFFKWVGEPTHHPGPFLHKLRFVFPNLRGDPVSVCLPLESRCIRSDPFGFLGLWKKHHFPKIKRKVVVLEGNEEGIY